MKLLPVSLVLFLFLMGQQVPVQAQAAPADEACIRATLLNYIEGRNGDTVRLRKAFQPQADLRFVHSTTGQFTSWSLNSYVKGSVGGPKLNCTARIVSCDIAGTAAQAKIIIDYSDRSFTDYLNLLKIEGN